MKITFIIPNVAAARVYKTIKAYQRLGITARVLAFERDYFNPQFEKREFVSLGRMDHRKYLKRIPTLLRSFQKIQNAVRDSDVMCAFGLDCLALGLLASRSRPNIKIVYDIGDIREILLSKFIISRIMRFIERYLLHRVSVIVVTSEAFITEYFHKIQGLYGSRFYLIENKLNLDTYRMKKSVWVERKDTPFRIGYHGVLRCKRSLQILEKAVEIGSGRIQVIIRGFPLGVDDYLKNMIGADHIFYGGPYISPDDLPEMYSQIDMIWACYPYNKRIYGNHRWARTNRFYEACYFQKPMFANKDNEDGRIVDQLDIGMSIDLSNIESAAEEITKIDGDDILGWQRNISGLPKHIYTFQNEHIGLIEILNKNGSS